MAAAVDLRPTTPSSSTAKPLAQHPVFPLSPLELSRWNRFARKGGIGAARAVVDKVSEDGVKDLMFLEGDQVVVLMDLGEQTYLGFCEGVVGLFHSDEVQMLQAKLKRPVISSRPTTAGSAAPAPEPSAPAAPPPAPQLLPRSATSCDVRDVAKDAGPPVKRPSRPLSRSNSFVLSATSASAAIDVEKKLPAPKRKPVPEVEVLAEQFDAARPCAGTGGGGADLRSRRKGDVAGLGIAVGGQPGGASQGGRRRSRSFSGLSSRAIEMLAGSRAADLPGAFATPQSASIPAFGSAAPSPASSFTSSANTRTPSLMTSPYSDYADHDDSASASSSGAHSSAYLGPPVTPLSASVGFDSTVVAGQDEYLHPAGLGGSSYDPNDFTDGPTPTVEKFPSSVHFPPPPSGSLGVSSAPTPANSPLVNQPLGQQHSHPPTPPTKDFLPSVLNNVSPSSSLSSSAAAPLLRSQFSLDTLSSAAPSQPSTTTSSRRPSHVLGSDGFPVPHPRSAFSFSPNSSITSTLPPSIMSASGLAERREQEAEQREAKSSGSTIGSSSSAGTFSRSPSGSIPGTPGEDQTLAFIYASYGGESRSSSAAASRAPSESGRSGKATPSVAGSPVRSLKSLRRTESEDGAAWPADERSEATEDEEEGDVVPALGSPARAFGAASQLRDRIRLGVPPPAQSSLPLPLPSTSSSRPRHASLLSISSSLDGVHIPRMSQIFPRSATDDSLATLGSLRSSESESSMVLGDGEAARYRFGMRARTRSAEEEKDATPKKSALPLLPPQGAEEDGAELLQAGGEQHDEHDTPQRRERTASVPVTDAADLADDLAASRRLFETFFSPPPKELTDAAAASQPRSRLVIGLPDSPTRSNSHPDAAAAQRQRRKTAKGLFISPPVVPGIGLGLANSDSPASAPLWRSSHNSPVQQVLPRNRRLSDLSADAEEPDVFVASPASMQAPPLLEVVGASPYAPRTYASANAPADESAALHPPSALLSYETSPSSFSHGSFVSAPSSPHVTDPSSYPTPPSSASVFAFPSAGPNKLRKAPQRMKSSPSLSSFASGSSDPFTESSGPPRLHRRPSQGLFSRSKQDKGKERASPTVDRKVDYSAGISHKDFEEETVQIGRSEFEIVKPLAALLGSGEEEAIRSASLDETRSRSSADTRPSHDDLVTPRRPPPPSHLPTNISTFSTQTMHSYASTSAPPSTFSHSAVSLSHFSPATPSSVEDAGRAAVEDHRSRETKWLQVLGSYTPQQAKKSKKLRALVHSGVPSSVRGKVWAFLAEAEVEKHAGVYQTLCEMDRLPPSAIIERDLERMLLDHPQFAPGTAGRDDLEAVLHAFARYDMQLVYFSGLADIVALLLTQQTAESAFWTLCSLVRNYGLRQFFPAGKEELRLEILAFGFLLETMESKLAKRLRELSISPSDFLANWSSTLFLSVLPLPTVLRLVDLLLFDPKTRHRAPLALLDLSHLDDSTVFPTRDAVLNHLLAPPPSAFSPALLIPAVATMKLSDDKVKKAYKKAAQAMLKPQAPPPFR
ncbi:hypothetical protein JCM10207_001715 [Rhodosporidiobolus poonsookiae]